MDQHIKRIEIADREGLLVEAINYLSLSSDSFPITDDLLSVGIDPLFQSQFISRQSSAPYVICICCDLICVILQLIVIIFKIMNLLLVFLLLIFLSYFSVSAHSLQLNNKI